MPPGNRGSAVAAVSIIVAIASNAVSVASLDHAHPHLKRRAPGSPASSSTMPPTSPTPTPTSAIPTATPTSLSPTSGAPTTVPPTALPTSGAPTTAEPTMSPTIVDYFRVINGSQFCETRESGRCVVDGRGRYGNNERCVVEVLRQTSLKADYFITESGSDYVEIDQSGNAPRKISGMRWPRQISVSPGDRIRWRSDHSITADGWRICAEDTQSGDNRITQTWASRLAAVDRQQFETQRMQTRYFNLSFANANARCQTPYNGACISDGLGYYGAGEFCQFTVLRNTTLRVLNFSVLSGATFALIPQGGNAIPYNVSSNGLDGLKVNSNTVVRFTTQTVNPVVYFRVSRSSPSGACNTTSSGTCFVVDATSSGTCSISVLRKTVLSVDGNLRFPTGRHYLSVTPSGASLRKFRNGQNPTGIEVRAGSTISWTQDPVSSSRRRRYYSRRRRYYTRRRRYYSRRRRYYTRRRRYYSRRRRYYYTRRRRYYTRRRRYYSRRRRYYSRRRRYYSRRRRYYSRRRRYYSRRRRYYSRRRRYYYYRRSARSSSYSFTVCGTRVPGPSASYPDGFLLCASEAFAGVGAGFFDLTSATTQSPPLQCATDGLCISDGPGNVRDGERCNFKVVRSTRLSVQTFNVQSSSGARLIASGRSYPGGNNNTPWDAEVRTGSTIVWNSGNGNSRTIQSGFRICASLESPINLVGPTLRIPIQSPSRLQIDAIRRSITSDPLPDLNAVADEPSSQALFSSMQRAAFVQQTAAPEKAATGSTSASASDYDAPWIAAVVISAMLSFLICCCACCWGIDKEDVMMKIFSFHLILLCVWVIIIIIMTFELNECTSDFAVNGGGNAVCENMYGRYGQCVDKHFDYECICPGGFSTNPGDNVSEPAAYLTGLAISRINGASAEDISKVHALVVELSDDTDRFTNWTGVDPRPMIDSVRLSTTGCAPLATGCMLGPRFNATWTELSQTANGDYNLGLEQALNMVLSSAMVENVGSEPICCNPDPKCSVTDAKSYYITSQKECDYVARSGENVHWYTDSGICGQVANACGSSVPESLSTGCCVGVAPAAARTDWSPVVNTVCRNTTLPYDACRDIDECPSNPCAAGVGPTGGNSVCINKPGGYECTCEDPNYEYKTALGCQPIPGSSIVLAPTVSPTSPPVSVDVTSCNADGTTSCGPGSGLPQDYCVGVDEISRQMNCNDGNEYTDYVCVDKSGTSATWVLGGTVGRTGGCSGTSSYLKGNNSGDWTRRPSSLSELSHECPGIANYIAEKTYNRPFFTDVSPVCSSMSFGTLITSEKMCAYAGRTLGLGLSAELEALPQTLPLSSVSGNASTDVCYTTVVGGSTVTAFGSLGNATISNYVCQRMYGCTEEDKRFNRYDCDSAISEDAFIILVVVAVALLVEIGVVALAEDRIRSYPFVFFCMVYFSQLDMATDVLYYTYETFATVALEKAALSFIILPFGILVYIFLIVAGGAVSTQQFVTRLTFLTSFTRGRWYRIFGYLIEPTIQLLLLFFDSFFAWVWACGGYFSNKFEAWRDLFKEHGSNIFKAMFLMLIALPGVAIFLFVSLSGLVLVPICIASVPLIWSIFVLLKIYVLFPKLWTWLKGVAITVFSALRVPKTDEDEWFFSHGFGMFETSDPDVVAASVAMAFHLHSSENQKTRDDSTVRTRDDIMVQDVDVDTQIFLLALSLLFEALVETIPQIVIQSLNNNARSTWSLLALTSILLSGIVMVEGVWRVLFKWLVLEEEFGAPESFRLNADRAALLRKSAEEREETRLAMVASRQQRREDVQNRKKDAKEQKRKEAERKRAEAARIAEAKRARIAREKAAKEDMKRQAAELKRKELELRERELALQARMADQATGGSVSAPSNGPMFNPMVTRPHSNLTGRRRQPQQGVHQNFGSPELGGYMEVDAITDNSPGRSPTLPRQNQRGYAGGPQAPPPRQSELRIDPSDGCSYDIDSFIAEYGGSRRNPPRQWLTATSANMSRGHEI